MRDRFWLIFLPLLVLSFCQPGHCDLVTVRRQILGPDGKPAVGAQVLLRTFAPPDGPLTREWSVVTDSDGWFETTVNRTWDPVLGGLERIAYLQVSAPGCALTFSNFGEWINAGPSTVGPIRLVSAFMEKRTLLDDNKKPVTGACVTVVEFSNDASYPWRLNYPRYRVTTPSLTAVSDGKGEFQLPGVVLDRPQPDEGSGQLAAAIVLMEKEKETRPLAAEQQLDFWITPEKRQAAEQETYTLHPAFTVRGKVTQALTGKPVVGATVEADARGNSFSFGLPVALTDNNGRYCVSGIPVTGDLYIYAKHPALAAGVNVVFDTGAVIRESATGVYDDINITLSPWTSFSGKVLDKGTGLPPTTPVRLHDIVFWGDAYPSEQTSTSTGVGGTFHLKSAVGANELLLRAKGYSGILNHEVADAPLPPGGKRNVVLYVSESRGYLIDFVPLHGHSWDYYNLFVRTAEGKESMVPFEPLWFSPADHWGETIEIRMTRSGTEVMPWTEVKADSSHWPLKITVP